MDSPHKECVLIGGLPCSGKTRLAVEQFPTFFLIDDPTSLVEQVIPHIHRSLIVVTSPHFSFKNVRKKAGVFFKEAGYSVAEIVLDVDKEILLERALVEGKEGRESFIKNFFIESVDTD